VQLCVVATRGLRPRPPADLACTTHALDATPADIDSTASAPPRHPPAQADETRSAIVRALRVEDEAKFIDFSRATIFITEEHTIFER
jgi:hypothetical protein